MASKFWVLSLMVSIVKVDFFLFLMAPECHQETFHPQLFDYLQFEEAHLGHTCKAGTKENKGLLLLLTSTHWSIWSFFFHLSNAYNATYAE